MKQSFYWFSALMMLIVISCSISKEVREQRNTISGTWTLENIRYEDNSGTFKARLFNDADAICFEGSEWYFRDNNSTGRYTIDNSSICQGGDRFIRWSVQESPTGIFQLQFKFIDENRKDISGGSGFRLDIATLDQQEMVLESDAVVDGESVTVVYEFNKKS